MNIQEYISSGIIESYVLGLASNEEKAAFEQLLSVHPELQQAKEAFEISLERHALDNAMPAPAAIKQKIWEAIELSPVATLAGNNTERTDGIAVTPAPVRSMNTVKWLAAASVILLLGSTLLNFYFYSQYKNTSAQLSDLIAQNQQMASNNTIMQTRLQQYESNFQIVKDTNMAVVAMKGQAVAPESATTVYWNKQTKDVYLLVNDLPQPVSGKQYQLWAIVDGVPVDAGTLDMAQANGLVKMKNIPRAQAFAITLENAGGSKTPTMPIYVVGKT
ncbi:MAG TPA: anti-sigma factor [Chitinophagaceae bacterium]|nr:anti-sigma factor [Chitinophagaceae bacterium]